MTKITWKAAIAGLCVFAAAATQSAIANEDALTNAVKAQEREDFYDIAYENFRGVSAEKRVQKQSAGFVRTLNRQDAAGLAEFYRANGVLKLPNLIAVGGKADIQAAWQGGFDAGIRSVELNVTQLQRLGRRRILEGGTYELTIQTPNGPIIQEGTFAVLWHVPHNPRRKPTIIFDAIDAN